MIPEDFWDVSIIHQQILVQTWYQRNHWIIFTSEDMENTPLESRM